MRKNLLIALAAGFALALTAAPSFADSATPQQGGGKSVSGSDQQGAPASPAADASSKDKGAKNCADILANKTAHTDAEVAGCPK
jgi:hypothetical protein